MAPKSNEETAGKGTGPMSEHAPHIEGSTTISTGTTIRLERAAAGTVVVIDHPDAPDDMRNSEAGRIIDGGFQPAPFAAFALRPETLRAIADLIDTGDKP